MSGWGYLTDADMGNQIRNLLNRRTDKELIGLFNKREPEMTKITREQLENVAGGIFGLGNCTFGEMIDRVEVALRHADIEVERSSVWVVVNNGQGKQAVLNLDGRDGSVLSNQNAAPIRESWWGKGMDFVRYRTYEEAIKSCVKVGMDIWYIYQGNSIRPIYCGTVCIVRDRGVDLVFLRGECVLWPDVFLSREDAEYELGQRRTGKGNK